MESSCIKAWYLPYCQIPWLFLYFEEYWLGIEAADQRCSVGMVKSDIGCMSTAASRLRTYMGPKKKIFHSTIQEIPPDVRLLLCGVRVSVHYSAMFGQAFAVSNGKSLRSWGHIAQLHHCRSPQFPLKRYLDIIISRSLVTGMGIGVAMRWPYRDHIDGILDLTVSVTFHHMLGSDF